MDTAVREETTLRISRSYSASLPRVWDAWTKPEEMRHWMGPPESTREPDISVDLRIGGRYRLVMYPASGETHRVGGVYRVIEAQRRLVYTWAWESTPERESLVTVEFRPDGKDTQVLLTHERFADRAARDNHGLGWRMCLDRLTGLFTR
jgi:uncharacterized protein YndB with AHSA1/START domain